jgi:hypothetical protein
MKYWMAMAVCMVGLAAGCRDEGPPPAGRADLVPASQYPNIVATENLDLELRFGPAVVQPAQPGIPMRVTQPVRNISDHDLNVQYRFIFMDQYKRPLVADPGWKYVTLAGEGVGTTMDSNSLSDTAADWRLEIRPAR